MAVTIPQNVAREKKFKIGDDVKVNIEPAGKKKAAKITPEFIKWVDKYIENNRPALEELAHK